MKKWIALIAAMFSAQMASAAGGWVGPTAITDMSVIGTNLGNLCYINLSGTAYVFVINDAGTQAKCDIAMRAHMNGDPISLYQDNTISLTFTWTGGPTSTLQQALSVGF